MNDFIFYSLIAFFVGILIGFIFRPIRNVSPRVPNNSNPSPMPECKSPRVVTNFTTEQLQAAIDSCIEAVKHNESIYYEGKTYTAVDHYVYLMQIQNKHFSHIEVDDGS